MSRIDSSSAESPRTTDALHTAAMEEFPIPVSRVTRPVRLRLALGRKSHLGGVTRLLPQAARPPPRLRTKLHGAIVRERVLMGATHLEECQFDAQEFLGILMQIRQQAIQFPGCRSQRIIELRIYYQLANGPLAGNDLVDCDVHV